MKYEFEVWLFWLRFHFQVLRRRHAKSAGEKGKGKPHYDDRLQCVTEDYRKGWGQGGISKITNAARYLGSNGATAMALQAVCN